jgi:hypothetical protein
VPGALRPTAPKVLLIGLCLAAARFAVLSSEPAVSGTTVAVRASGDASVNSAKPAGRYGRAKALKIDGAPLRRAYLRFTVPEGMPVLRATLVLQPRRPVAFDVYEAPDTWTESAITWEDAPLPGDLVAASGPVTAGTPARVDVTDAVAGKRVVNLVVATASNSSQTFSSREAGSRGPQLVIETELPEPAPLPGPPASPDSPPASTGTAYYVDADSGDDSASGTSPAQAWRSLAKASRVKLEPGAQLLFERGGSWTGRLTLADEGTAAEPITISAYGSGDRPSISGDCLQVSGAHLVITGLDVHDCSWEGIGVSGHDNWIEDNLVRHNVTGIFLRKGAVDNRVRRNQVRDNNRMSVLTPQCCNDSGAFGILLHGDRTEVAYNTISGSDAFSYDYGRDGAAVEVYGGQGNHVHHNVAVDNDTFVELGNPRSADNTFAYNLVRSALPQSIFVVTRGAGSGYGPIARTTLVNNTAVLTGAASQGVICHAGCDAGILTMRNNIVVATVKAGFADGPFDDDRNLWGGKVQFVRSPTSLRGDPRFVDAGAGDFRLRSDSPAVDRGVASGYAADLDGAPVPADGDGDGTTAPDLGGYERQP